MSLALAESSLPALGAHDVTRFLLAIGVLLLVSRALGEIARYFGQPTVLGEMAAGILLGPAVLGRVLPGVSAWLFPAHGPTFAMLLGLQTLAVVLFLLVAGLEVDLGRLARTRRTALTVGLLGTLVPFALGWLGARSAPLAFGFEPGLDVEAFALLVGVVCSVSALPVIARTLLDLGLYKSDFGMLVIASAIVTDLLGWIAFAVLLDAAGDTGASAWGMAALAVGFTVFMLTVGRWIVHRVLPWVQAHTAWPGGVIAFSIVLALACASFTEWFGLHAIIGAFLAGIALGDSAHLRERTRATVSDFASSFFAPLFFALIGLRVDFVSQFDLVVVLAVCAVACAGKLLGAGGGARLAGAPWRESIAMGFALNARGAMAIVLGVTAFENDLVGGRLLVAIVLMSLATSILAGPGMQRALDRHRPARFARGLAKAAFVPDLVSRDERGAVRELAEPLARAAMLPAESLLAAADARGPARHVAEGVMAACARGDGVEWPVIALGLARAGIPQASGGRTALVFLVLTPTRLASAEDEILRDLEATFADPGLRHKILAVRDYTELLALLRADGAAR